MAKLFSEPNEPKQSDPVLEGTVVRVALVTNVANQYDYLFPAALGEPLKGQRVKVPFGRGNRPTVGFITDIGVSPPHAKLKVIEVLLDDTPELTEPLWELAEWISHYYLCPLGPTLGAMTPSAVGKHGPKQEAVVFLADESTTPDRLGPKQRVVLDELLEARRQGIEPLKLEQLLHHSRASRSTIQSLLKRKLIRTEAREVTLEATAGVIGEDPFEINQEQADVLAAMEPKLAEGAGFSATLLHGVTGSGKTEVYVRAIRRVAARGKQAILMTPEIALATQTLKRIAERLPNVAILHSGLTNAQRAFYWRKIRTGEADVIIGPRSAIFAPAPNLGLIIVDEEHEPSYKQDNAPRYHGRDVAVQRANIENVPVLLGSATPSMESFHNAQLGRYDLLKLPSRVRGLAMPTLQIVHLRKEMSKTRIELLGQTLTERMATALDRGEQIILLMNRRGYASYVFCPSCQPNEPWMLGCEECSRPMVYHQAIQLAVCHHCQKTQAIPTACPACGGKLLLFGYGIQRVEDELARKFPLAQMARMDSDTMTSPKQFQKVLDDFASGEVNILLGTQMVAKGLDFPRVSLVGVVSADTSLGLNDFRAAERTFQLIVQVAGRAGRAETAGNVVVQTLNADEPAVYLAETHDYKAFAAGELDGRKGAGLPPFSRLTRFVIRHDDIAAVQESGKLLRAMLEERLPRQGVQIIGPQKAELERLKGQYRFHILVFTPKAGMVQNAIRPVLAKLHKETRADIAIDVDAVNLF